MKKQSLEVHTILDDLVQIKANDIKSLYKVICALDDLNLSYTTLKNSVFISKGHLEEFTKKLTS
jgi:hypothetical protein